MKNIIYTLLLLLMALPFASCSKDEDSSFKVEYPYIFVRDFGESGTTKFTSTNIVKYSSSSVPKGWTVEFSEEDHTIIATAPDKDSDKKYETSGIAYVYGTNADDKSIFVSLLLSIADRVEIDDPQNDQQANSMIVNKVNTIYTFNPNRRGESTTEVGEKAVDCEVTWITSGNPIQFVEMTDEGDISFYTFPDATSTADEVTLTEGNAIISALGKSGERLWSWHIWITKDAVEEVEVAGMKFLDRNIGAFQNANSSDEEILESYGLYYQWGRKDPFIYPSTYNAAGSTGAAMYNGDGRYCYTQIKLSNPLYGTMQYATLNPFAFITGDNSTSRDWLWGENQNSELWGSVTEKSIYDPSPKGYRIPTAEEYRRLTLDDSEQLTPESYGRMVGGDLFMALGQRTYLDGSIQNHRADGSFARWAGYYWSTTANGAQAEALYFDSEGKIEITPAPRAAGMQIRSIKME